MSVSSNDKLPFHKFLNGFRLQALETEKMFEAYHTSEHKLSPSPANPVTHLPIDYFNWKIVIVLVLPYGSQLQFPDLLVSNTSFARQFTLKFEFELYSALVISLRDYLVFGFVQSCENSYERLLF